MSTTTLLTPAPATAAVGINQQINYQGRLLTSTGAIVADGNYNMKFRIYQDGTGAAAGNPGGTLLWTELWQNQVASGSTGPAVVRNGYFSVNLGAWCTFTTGTCQGNSNTVVDFNQDTLWVSVEVDTAGTSVTNTPTYNGEMVPMKRLTTSIYSFNAAKLQGLDATKFVQLAQGVQTDASTTNASIFINKTNGSGTPDILTLQKAGSSVFRIDNTGNIIATGTYNGNTFTSSALTFSAAGTATIQAAANQNLSLQGNGTGDISLPTDADSNVQIAATAAPAIDQLVITNTGQAIATSNVNNLTLNFTGGAAAVEAGAERIDVNPSATSGSTWNGLRVIQNTTGPATGVTTNGIKLTGPTTGGAGTYNGITIANIGAVTTAGTTTGLSITPTNSQTAGTQRAITIGNLTAGTATEQAIDLGTGWDNLLTYSNGSTVLINGTGQWNLSQVSGTLSLANGGTNANLTASNGGIVWTNGTQMQILAGTGTANQCLVSGASSAPSWASCGIASILQVPGSTAQNTITPTANGINGLTINAGVTSTVSVGAAFNQSGTADNVVLTTTNTAGTQVNGLSVTRNGAGTTTNLLNIANTSGTATNAINISGTFATNLIASTNLNITNAGDVLTNSTLTLGALGTTNNANTLCRNSINVLAACNTTGAGAVYFQGGNTFTATGLAGTNDPNYLAFQTNGSIKFYVNGNGIGIGTAPNNAANINVSKTFSSATGLEEYGQFQQTNFTTADTGFKIGYKSNTVASNPSGNINNIEGLLGLITNTTTGTVANASVLWTRTDVSAGTITNAYGLQVNDGTGAGTITNQYGLYVNNLTKGATANFPLYLASSGTTPLLKVTNTGQATLQNSANSTSAFQVQNASGLILLGIDSATTSTNLVSNGDFETNNTGWAAKGTTTFPQTSAAAYTGTGSMLVTTSANLLSNGEFETNNTGWVAKGATTFPRSTVDAHTGTGSMLVTTATNLITNGGFETDNTGWAAKGTATFPQTTVTANTGTGSMFITTSAANSGAQFAYTMTTATTYTLKMFVKGGGAYSTIAMGRQDVSGTNVDCLTGQSINTTTWTQLTCTFTTGGTITSSNLYIYDTTTAHNFYVDGVYLVAGAYTGTGAQFAYTMSTATTYTLGMYVKATAATSTVAIGRQDVTGTNVDCLTAQTLSTTSWTLLTCSFTTGGTITSSNIYVTDSVVDGTTTNKSFYVDSVYLVPNSTVNSGAQFAFAMSANTTYTLSMFVKGTTSFSTLALGRQDISGTNTDCMTGKAVNTTSWTQLSCTFTTGATITSSNVYIHDPDISDITTALAFYVDQVSLVAGTSPYSAGNYTINGAVATPVTVKNQSDSNNALTFQNAAGTSMLNVDTQNNDVTIGTSNTPNSKWVTLGGASGGRARYGHSAVTYGNKIYYWGGFDGTAYVNTLDIYDNATNTWTVGVAGGTARYAHSAVVYGDKMYIWGGGNGVSLSTVDVYNFTTSAWTVSLAYTGTPSARQGHTATVYGNKMYILGGWNLTTTFNTVDIYDIVNASWSTGTTGGTARRAHGATLFGNKIYSYGGWDGTTYFNSLDIYDITNNSWSVGNTGGVARRNITAVSYGNKMYIFGGYNGTTNFANVSDLMTYDYTTGIWSEVLNGGSARYFHTAVVNGSKMYIWGGVSAVDATNSLEVLDLPSMKWSVANPESNRQDHSMVTYGGKLYVYGGRNGGGTNYTNSLKIYDPTTNSWSDGASGLSLRNRHTAVVYGDKMYVWGGLDITSTRINTMEIYNFTTNTWSTGLTGGTARYSVMAVVYGDKMYIWGDTSTAMDIYNFTTNAWTTGTASVGTRSNPVTVVYGDKIYYYGDGSNGIKTMDIYNLTTSTWSAGTAGGTGVGQATGSVIGSNFYVIGGYDGSRYVNSTSIYDFAANTWSVGPIMSRSRAYTMSAVLGGKIYVYGGYANDTLDRGQIEVLDPFGATPTVAVFGTSTADPVAVTNGSVYFNNESETLRCYGGASGWKDCTAQNGNLGQLNVQYNGNGNNYAATISNLNSSANSSGLLIDLAVDTSARQATNIFVGFSGMTSNGTGSWSTGSSGGTTRAYASGVVYGNKFYNWGGWNGTTNYQTMDVYDFSANTWATSFSTGGTARRSQTAVVYKGKIYFWGGFTTVNLTSLDIYDIATSTWTTGASGGTPRRNHNAVVYGTKMYITGGLDNGSAPSAVLDIYDFETNTWSTGTNEPNARYAHSSVVYGNKIYNWAGTNGSNINTLDIYDISTNTWAAGVTGGTARRTHQAVVYGNKMYAYGGWNGTTAFATVDIFDFATNSWSTGTSSAAGTYAYTMAAYNNNFYTWSGQNTAGTYLNSVDIFTFGTGITGQVVAGKIQGYSGGVGSSGSVAYTTFGADYAEYFRANPDDLPKMGELVLLDTASTQGVLRSPGSPPGSPPGTAPPTDSVPIAGIVSTNPGFIGNAPLCSATDDNCDKNYAKYNALVALSGQVPAKVNDTNGPISVGDPITISAVAGEGAKATVTGYIVGYALEPMPSGSGTIKVLVRPQHYTASSSQMVQGSGLNIAGNATISGNATIGGTLDVAGMATLGALSVSGDALVSGTLTVTNLIAQNIKVNRHIITGGTTPTVAVGTGAGAPDVVHNIAAPTVAAIGSDTSGTVTIVTGSGTIAGELAKISFTKPFNGKQKIVLTPANLESALVGAYADEAAGSNADFTIFTDSAPVPGKTYTFSYFVVQ